MKGRTKISGREVARRARQRRAAGDAKLAERWGVAPGDRHMLLNMRRVVGAVMGPVRRARRARAARQKRFGE